MGAAPIPRLGVHVRAGDAYILKGGGETSDRRQVIVHPQWGLNTPRQAAQHLVHCAQEVAIQMGWDQMMNLSQPSPCVIFFESDSEEAKDIQNFHKKLYNYPCRVVSHQERVMHTRPDNKGVSGADTMHAWASLLRLSSTDLIISSESGFSDFAAALGPGLSHEGRHLKIEDVLYRRIKAGATIHDKKGLCNFTRFGSKARRGFLDLLKKNGSYF